MEKKGEEEKKEGGDEGDDGDGGDEEENGEPKEQRDDDDETQPDYMEPRMIAKYELMQMVGKGAYGVVWKAISKRNREVVAIKKIFDAYSNPIDAKRSWREVYFLNELKHPNIMQVDRIRKAANERDLYIVAEFIENDLHAVIRANICEDIQNRYIIFSLLRALRHMHQSGIIHRDIKPSNVLINRDCIVKLADFSLARFIGGDQEELQGTLMSDYVSARWYRAPEILLGSSQYDETVDMWGLGCILAELYLNRPLFPGSSTLNQVSRIIEVTGTPDAKALAEIHSPVARTMFENLKLNRGPPRDLEDMIPRAPEDAIELMKALLVFKPSERIDADEALKSDYVRYFYEQMDDKEEEALIENQPDINPKNNPYKLDDNKTYKVEDYKREIYKYIKKVNREKRKKQADLQYAKYKDYQV